MRKSEHFIDSYMDYTAMMESPDSFHQWCAISLISTSLRRQVWLKMGHFRIYPNMYIVLVSDPGVCRKSVAISTAIHLFKDFSDIKISADSTTREALIRALKHSEETLTYGKEEYTQSAITVVSKELSVFLGTGNSDFLSLLTDLFDCPDFWEYRTKNSGIDSISNVWLSILGASTPEWLSSSIPISAIGGGFTSRVIFVVEGKGRKKVAFPELTNKEVLIGENLKHDLLNINQLYGEFEITEQGRKYFKNWYEKHNPKLIGDKRFWGYGERKHIHVLKLALILSVAEGNSKKVTELHLRQALYMLDAIEPGMMQAFGGAGRSTESYDIDIVTQVIKEHGKISKQRLLEFIWRDVSPRVFDMVIDFLIDRRVIERSIEGGQVYYTYLLKGDMEDD